MTRVGHRLRATGDGQRPLAPTLSPQAEGGVLVSGYSLERGAYGLRRGLRAQRGVTLVELVISITVVSIAAASVLGVLSLSSTGSAEALVRHQAVAIGSAYLEEALLKPFVDPDGVDGEGVRTSFDDVNDYHGLEDDGARDQFGAALSGLEQYRVSMSVQNGSLGSITSASGHALRVDVTVRHPVGVAMTFTGYRTRY